MKGINRFLKFIDYFATVFLITISGILIILVFPITGNFKPLIVRSGSMEPAVKVGSIVMVKPTQEYKIGDIITFGRVGNGKTPITHRIVEIKVNSGTPIYFTEGDANRRVDQAVVRNEDIIGKVVFIVPYIGYLVDFIKKPLGFILIILLPLIFIIIEEIDRIKGGLKDLKVKIKRY